jgi:hypothetical protein
LILCDYNNIYTWISKAQYDKENIQANLIEKLTFYHYDQLELILEHILADYIDTLKEKESIFHYMQKFFSVEIFR